MKRRLRSISAVAVLLAAASAGCTDDRLPRASTTRDGSDIVVDVEDTGLPFDRRLLGTNVPAWIGPERLSDPAFVAATQRSGVSLLRMPGGSWSNSYAWLACELRDATGCPFTGSARPTDFIDFMKATGLPGSWTVSINETAHSAAAAVAFFNGRVDDERAIGVDRNGFDWSTVATWATLRAEGGHPHPVGIELWEVGNEVYGGRPEAAGAGCAPFGWEDVWTCDGDEYVLGDGDHDGFLAIRDAMLRVDPTLSIGAVGAGDPSGWGGWGQDVITRAGDALDIYVVHQYGFDEAPSPHDAVTRARELWPDVIGEIRSALPDDVKIAVTEHNLVAVESGDIERTMTQAMNALYLADTIGQLALAGVPIANQWNLANGTTESGTDYGMISLDDGSTFPTFEAMSLWSRAGEELLPVTLVDDALSVYATRHRDDRITLIVVNASADEFDRDVELSDTTIGGAARMQTSSATSPTASAMSTHVVDFPVVEGRVRISVPAWSVSAVEFGTL